MIGHYQIPDIRIRCHKQNRQICCDCLPVLQFLPYSQKQYDHQKHQDHLAPCDNSSILHIHPCFQISPVKRFLFAALQAILNHAHGSPEIPHPKNHYRDPPFCNPGQCIPQPPCKRIQEHKNKIFPKIFLSLSHPHPQKQNQRNSQRNDRISQKIKKIFHHASHEKVKRQVPCFRHMIFQHQKNQSAK